MVQSKAFTWIWVSALLLAKQQNLERVLPLSWNKARFQPCRLQLRPAAAYYCSSAMFLVEEESSLSVSVLSILFKNFNLWDCNLLSQAITVLYCLDLSHVLAHFAPIFKFCTGIHVGPVFRVPHSESESSCCCCWSWWCHSFPLWLWWHLVFPVRMLHLPASLPVQVLGNTKYIVPFSWYTAFIINLV